MVDGTLLSALLLVLGAGALFGGAELLVKGAGNLALGLGLRAATVGVTVVAFATTTPELFVAILGALDVSSDVGFGTVVGSNIANIALVLGVSALIHPLSISDAMMRRHVPFMVLAAVLLPVLALDGQIGQLEGVILLAVLAAFTGYLLHTVNSSPAAAEMPDGSREGVAPRDVAFVLGGLVTLLVGSRWLISGGSSLLLAMGVSEFVVGVTVLALGTSLPELAASAVGAARGETEFTVGNVVGSNIYNIVAVLGLLAVAVPITVTDSVLRFELPLVVVFTLVLVGMMWRGRRLTRVDGAVLVVSYAVFVRFLFV
ncbi:calcium/sodium antiporter [Natronosalvus halobius]|uniref:calcium/sodium antiporter n=1 Tax=Natronosalvus halobius TaxID=2953746 RepID=UPI0020A06D1E|nr:calcium/sodium antiporter [Natronosalvus halobius]USZ73010.1 calcium/sodium antiporter [Natronosalvus halobius]